jgi:hypothetical protein
MGFSFRRRKNFGPFALNFSTKGIGISGGVTGARVSVGPRGTFVNLGRQGFYYRKKIGGFSERTRKQNIPNEELVQEVDKNRIESADIKSFQNSSSDNLLNEIREKNALVKYSKVSLGISIALFIIAPLAGSPAWLNLSIIILSIVSYSVFFKKDAENKIVTVMYELDKDMELAFEKMNNGFKEFGKTAKIWRIETQEATSDWKRNSGALNLVNRKGFQILNELPPFFDSNIIPYGFKIDNKQYYFFPDRILIYQGKDVGMAPYSEFKINTSITRFIEDGGVPRDAEVVGHNWKYVNRDGGPDRRFSNNRQIPVVLYSEIDLRTSSGINLKFQTSDKRAGENFSKSFKDIRQIGLTGHGINPQDAAAWDKKGEALYNQDDHGSNAEAINSSYADAIKAYAEAIRFNPDLAEAGEKINALNQQGKYDDATSGFMTRPSSLIPNLPLTLLYSFSQPGPTEAPLSTNKASTMRLSKLMTRPLGLIPNLPLTLPHSLLLPGPTKGIF